MKRARIRLNAPPASAIEPDYGESVLGLQPDYGFMRRGPKKRPPRRKRVKRAKGKRRTPR